MSAQMNGPDAEFIEENAEPEARRGSVAEDDNRVLGFRLRLYDLQQRHRFLSQADPVELLRDFHAMCVSRRYIQ